MSFAFELREKSRRNIAVAISGAHFADGGRTLFAVIDDDHFLPASFDDCRRADLLARAACGRESEIRVMICVVGLCSGRFFDA